MHFTFMSQARPPHARTIYAGIRNHSYAAHSHSLSLYIFRRICVYKSVQSGDALAYVVAATRDAWESKRGRTDQDATSPVSPALQLCVRVPFGGFLRGDCCTALPSLAGRNTSDRKLAKESRLKFAATVFRR